MRGFSSFRFFFKTKKTFFSHPRRSAGLRSCARTLAKFQRKRRFPALRVEILSRLTARWPLESGGESQPAAFFSATSHAAASSARALRSPRTSAPPSPYTLPASYAKCSRDARRLSLRHDGALRTDAHAPHRIRQVARARGRRRGGGRVRLAPARRGTHDRRTRRPQVPREGHARARPHHRYVPHPRPSPRRDRAWPRTAVSPPPLRLICARPRGFGAMTSPMKRSCPR